MSAILRNPWVATPHTLVRDAIAQMEGEPTLDTAHDMAHRQRPPRRGEDGCGCVLVVEDNRIRGILTVRDMVRLSAQQPSFGTRPVGEVMSPSGRTWRESDCTDVLKIANFMQQHSIHHLPIVDDQDCLVGLITPTSVLQALNPLALYQQAEQLEAAVICLEAEKGALLEARTNELEQQVEERTQALLLRAERETLLASLATQIRSSLSLQSILDATVEQVRKILGCDRVNIWQFEDNWQTTVVAESTDSPLSLMGEQITDICFQQTQAELYRQGRIRVVSDIYAIDMSDCHRDMLLRLQTRAKILIPLLCGDQLWGLLNATSQQPRDWQPSEVELLQALSVHLAIALQQATTHQQLQVELNERRQAEARLRESEQRYASLAAAVPVGIFRTDAAGRCTYVNERWCEITGLSPEAAVGEGWQRGLHREDINRVIRLWEKAVRENHPACIEFRYQCPDGRVNWVYGQSVAERNADGQIIGYVGTLTDISDRKQAEQDLQHTQNRLCEAQRLAHLGNWELNLQTNTLYWSDEVFNIFELNPQETKASYETFLTLIHPEDRDRVNDVYTDHLRDRVPYNIVHRLLLPDGRIKYVQEQCESFYAEDGTPLLSQGTVQDITSLKQAELEREWAEDALRQVVVGTATTIGGEFFPALVRHIAEALGVRYVSVSQATPNGFKVLAFFANGMLCPPELLPYCSVPCCVQALELGECCHPHSIQTLYPTNDLFARLQVESYLGIGLRNAAGEPNGNLCILHDHPLHNPDWAKTLLRIFAARAGAELERYQTAQALEQLTAELEQRVDERTAQLRERDAQLEDLFENANDLIQSVRLEDGRFEYVNRVWRDTLGYSAAEVEQLVLFDVLHPDYHSHCQQLMAQILGGTICTLERMELIFLTKDQRQVLLEGNLNCRLEGDRPVATRAIFRDITERKAAEQLLQEREARYRAVMDHASDAILLADSQGRLVEVNRKGEELLGYSREELTHLHISQIHPSDVLEAVANHFNSILLHDHGPSFETLVLRKDGTCIPVDITGSRLELNGQSIAQGIFRDIRDRKQAETALRESQQFLQTVLDTFPLSVFWKDRNSVYLGGNRHFLHDVGRTSITDVIGKTDDDLPWAERAEDYRVNDRQVMASNTPKLNIIATVQEGDTQIWTETNKFPLYNLMGELVGVLGTCQDISDRKRAELDLQASEQRFRRMFDSSVVGMLFADLQGRIVDANDRFLQIIGYTREDLQTGTIRWDKITPPEYIALDAAGLEQLMQQGAVDPIEKEYYRKDGSRVPVLLGAALLPGLEGQAICVAIDISDRKQAEQIIRQQARREVVLREITQRIRQSLDLQTIFDTACQEIRHVLQADRVSIFKFYPDSGHDEGEFVAESVVAGYPSVVAIPVQDHCFGDRYAPLYAQGRYQVVDDIYEHRLTPCHTHILTQFQVRASLVMPLLCGEDRLWGLLCVHQCSSPRHWHQSEIDLSQQLANQLAIAIQQAYLFEQLQQELTERQQAQQQLTERNQQLAISNQELARATRLKDEFLANMSHELRTPLNAILGMTEGLQEHIFGMVNDQQIKALQTIENSAFHLLSLINDILDVAKIESGQIDLEYSSIPLTLLCSSSLTFIKQQAVRKHIQLEVRLSPDLPNLWGDERRIRQVLINLLTNAVKFTPDGGKITLVTSLTGADLGGQDFLRIAVIDTGIGIAPENISKLFQPFVQIDSALNRQYTGTGLGLALVKQIVELHGGQVSVTSDLGVGSCFTIDLPCTPTALPSSDPTVMPFISEAGAAGIHSGCVSHLILLAEDNEANISTLESYLQAKGYRLLLAHNGQEAIALAQSQHPDLILMDIQMPGMDGIEAMQLIRRNPALVNTPIIALTALAMEGDRERCLAAGATDYLSKPIKLKQLTMVIQHLLGCVGG